MSRGCARGYAPARHYGFKAFSPFTVPNVVEVSEGIPFIELTDWDHERLYRLKGEVVAAGVQALTGYEMPIFEKRRFQHGVASARSLEDRYPRDPAAYRAAFQSLYDGRAPSAL